MKYKALFLDLDGTTIPNKPDGMPSKRVADAIHKAKPYIHVCIASSRPLVLAKPVIDHLDINGLCVLTDATQIYDPANQKIIQTIYLEKSSLKHIINVLTKNKIHFYINLGSSERLYTDDLKPQEKVCSIYFDTASSVEADNIIDDLTTQSNISALKLPSWTKGRTGVSITHATATKLHGIMTIAKYLNIETKDMIGVGDGHNDYPLLSACGLKIAMGNAVPELKAIADFIAPTVEDDGVVTVIEKFILSS